MPIFQLKCEKCGKEMEKIVSYQGAQKTECPDCSTIMKIQPSRGAFRVEGFAASNGYHRETIDYAKGPIG